VQKSCQEKNANFLTFFLNKKGVRQDGANKMDTV